MNGLGALAGIVTGGVTVVVWRSLSGGIFEVYEIVPGFIAASIAIVVFSLIGKAPSDEESETFQKVQALVKSPSGDSQDEPVIS